MNEVFQKVKRADFLPEDVKYLADLDEPLPIGFGQTNSQPYTVRLMLSWLGPKEGHKILEVGSGSGWVAALIADIIGSKGCVYALEKIPELLRFGADNCQKQGIKNVIFLPPGPKQGLPEYSPYDRIIVSASASHVPKGLVEQLKAGGRLIIPVLDSILEIDKINEFDYEILEHPGFTFVPLK